MLALRFANGIFEPIWNRQFIDHVQITVAESMGIEGRAGVLRAGGRDPRHLPEPPAAAPRADGDGAADRLHRRLGPQREGEGAARAAHARARSASSAASTAAASSRARRCPATARRRASRRDSITETFVAAKLYVDNWRWADTPVLRPRRQAAAAARDDDRDPVQAGAAPALRGDRGRRAAAERAARSTSSRTRASRSRSAPRCPGRG